MMANMSPEMMQSMMAMAGNRGAASPGAPAANAASTAGQQPAPGKLGDVFIVHLYCATKQDVK